MSKRTYGGDDAPWQESLKGNRHVDTLKRIKSTEKKKQSSKIPSPGLISVDFTGWRGVASAGGGKRRFARSARPQIGLAHPESATATTLPQRAKGESRAHSIAKGFYLDVVCPSTRFVHIWISRSTGLSLDEVPISTATRVCDL